jgi:hypothetical protein
LYLVPLVLWCVDFRLGIRICAAMAITLYLNSTLKEWFAQPRPFEFDDRVVSAGSLPGPSSLEAAGRNQKSIHGLRRGY